MNSNKTCLADAVCLSWMHLEPLSKLLFVKGIERCFFEKELSYEIKNEVLYRIPDKYTQE